MESIIILVAITVIGLGLVYLVLTQIFKILGAIAKRGPDLTKGACILGGIFLIIWIITSPDQAQTSFDQWVQIIQTKLGYSEPPYKVPNGISGEFF